MQMICIILLWRVLLSTARMNRFALLLLLSWCQAVPVSVASTAADDALVNERLTASGAAMERHWQVDCQAALVALTTPIGSVPAGARAALGETLRKCRFIYQPPGESAAGACPDYAALLQAWQGLDDATLKAQLEHSQHCPPTLEMK
ncbi:hypothetical protein [Pseudohalioglobus lutimaris]|nr:hypothetical protein [Pseudohalioglobus lutimaris]